MSLLEYDRIQPHCLDIKKSLTAANVSYILDYEMLIWEIHNSIEKKKNGLHNLDQNIWMLYDFNLTINSIITFRHILKTITNVDLRAFVSLKFIATFNNWSYQLFPISSGFEMKYCQYHTFHTSIKWLNVFCRLNVVYVNFMSYNCFRCHTWDMVIVILRAFMTLENEWNHVLEGSSTFNQ